MKTTVTLSYLFLALIFNNVVFAQDKTISDEPFVRVYNLEGKKIFKGKIVSVTDTLLQLKREKMILNVNLNDIGMIKTKRSNGNNILLGSLIGVGAGAAILMAAADPDAWLGWTVQEGALMGILLGAPTGAAFGAISNLFKKSKTFFINGNVIKWKLFQEAISN